MTGIPLKDPPEAGRWIRSTFALSRATAVNRLSSGAFQAMNIDAPLWRVSFETEPLSWERRCVWCAWERSLRGGLRAFTLHDLIFAYPIAYGAGALSLTRAAGGTFNGAATLAGCTEASVSLAGLPADYQAKAGDRLSFAWRDGRAYHEVSEDALGTSDGTLTVMVEPAVMAPHAVTGTEVAMIRAPVIMIMEHETWSGGDGPGKEPISFTAIQVV